MIDASAQLHLAARLGRIDSLLVQEGRVIASTAPLAWTRGRPWEEIARRLALLGYRLKRER